MNEENHRAIHSAEAISVDWNNYSDCVIDAVKALFEDTRLADVTLACEGQFATAHQFLLSASSPFFKDLFEAHLPEKGKNAVIILSGIRMKYLRRVLQFIYTGRVQIPPHDLDEFLEAGEILKIRGLSNSFSDSDASVSPDRFTNNRNEQSSSSNSRYADGRPNPKRSRTAAADVQQMPPLNHFNQADYPHSSHLMNFDQRQQKHEAPVFSAGLWEDDHDQDQDQDQEQDPSDYEAGDDSYFMGDEMYDGSGAGDVTISRGQVPGPPRPRHTSVKAETLLKLGKAALQKREGFQLSARAQTFFEYLGHLPPIDAEGKLNKKQIERRKRRFFARCKLCAKEISACGCDHDLLSHLKTHKIALD